MKRLVAVCLFAFAAVLVVACSDGGGPNPVGPINEASGATAVTADARSNSYPILLCHPNPDETDGDPAWVVIQVDDDSRKQRGHLRHGDYTTGSCSGLNTLSVGDDCSCCTTASCGQV